MSVPLPLPSRFVRVHKLRKAISLPLITLHEHDIAREALLLSYNKQSIYVIFFQHDHRCRREGPLIRRPFLCSGRHGLGAVDGGGSAATRAHATRTHAASASPSSPNGGGQCRRRRQFNRQSGAKDFKYITNFAPNLQGVPGGPSGPKPRFG